MIDSWYFDSCSREGRCDVWNTICFPVQDKNIWIETVAVKLSALFSGTIVLGYNVMKGLNFVSS